MHVCLLNSCFCVAACLSRVRGYYTSTCFLEFLSVCRICRFRVTNEAGPVGVNWLSICLAQGLCFRSETSVNCSFGQAFSLVNFKKGDSALVPCWRFPQFNSNVASLSTNKTLGERQAGFKNAQLNEEQTASVLMQRKLVKQSPLWVIGSVAVLVNQWLQHIDGLPLQHCQEFRDVMSAVGSSDTLQWGECPVLL